MIKLFSGTGNLELSNKVAKLLNIGLSAAEVIRFDNSEVRVRIEEDVKNKLCVVIQPTANPTDTNVMELMFFCDALKRQEADKVIGILPYFGYARQDIQHRVGECISANVIIRFLKTIGFDKIYTFDLHDDATAGVFSIPFKNLTALPILADAVKNHLKLKNPTPEKIAIVSPDQGGIERARKFGESFFGHSFFSIEVIEKKRDRNVVAQSQALKLYGDVEKRTVIIVDDIVTSGGTLVNAAELCLKGGADKILAVIVHLDLGENAPERIKTSSIEKLFTTDTILNKRNSSLAKLSESTVSTIIAEELKTFSKAYYYRQR